MARVADFDDEGRDEPCADDDDEDEGCVPQEVGGVEEVAVEEEDGDLGEGDDGEGEGAVDVDVLGGFVSWTSCDRWESVVLTRRYVM